MRKIPKKYENPLDNVLIDLADFLSPCFKKMKFTPNWITTISLIMGLLSIYALWNGMIGFFIFFYFLSYFFDCFDGFFARKYDQVTKLGDFYDHVKDIIVALALMAVVIYRNKCSSKIWIPVMIIFIIFTILAYAQMGCQEKFYDKNESGTLNLGRHLCPGNEKKNMKWLRFFGMGTWVIITITLVIVLEKSRLCA